MRGRKDSSRELLKVVLFCDQKNDKKADSMKFSLTPNTSVQQIPQSLFQKQQPLILLPLFFKEHLNAQVRINKLVKKHSQLPP